MNNNNNMIKSIKRASAHGHGVCSRPKGQAMTSNQFALVSEDIGATNSTKSSVHSRDLRVATVAPTQRRELLLSVEERDGVTRCHWIPQ